MTQFEALLTDTDETDSQNETPNPCSCNNEQKTNRGAPDIDAAITLVDDAKNNAVSDCKKAKGTGLRTIIVPLKYVDRGWLDRFPGFPQTNDVTA